LSSSAHPAGTTAATATACTAIDLCYCVNAANRQAIDANVARLRQLIDEQRKLGKAIGYMSLPLSTVGGGYYGVNRDVAHATKERLERRFGATSVWMLDPAAQGNLPAGASGADYMYMWTTLCAGPRGLGEQFDFIYFVGPSDFRRFFALDGVSDLEKIDAYFDKRSTDDADLRKAVDENKVSKRTFRNYYGLRASVAFSYGAHDEWNIARIINERRRAAEDFGIANQLPMLFDDRAVAPGTFESPVASGNVGRCVN
jgi:hypothetical protein